MTFQDALAKLIDKDSGVSAHYLIKEDGEVFQLVDDKHIAWHAGKSAWHGAPALNENSIGIEIDNLGDREFKKAQMQALIELCQPLMKKYNIPKKNFIGHSDVAPDRKIDPGIFFDWKLCAQKGLGVWHNLEIQNNLKDLFVFGNNDNEIKTLQKNLKKLGYALEITGVFDQQTNFVIRAFQSKFCPKIIHKKGLEFYQNDESKYFWDSFSQQVLQKLLSIIDK
jgi:N-acetylmuramoyl-L-alanine amidase